MTALAARDEVAPGVDHPHLIPLQRLQDGLLRLVIAAEEMLRPVQVEQIDVTKEGVEITGFAAAAPGKCNIVHPVGKRVAQRAVVVMLARIGCDAQSCRDPIADLDRRCRRHVHLVHRREFAEETPLFRDPARVQASRADAGALELDMQRPRVALGAKDNLTR